MQDACSCVPSTVLTRVIGVLHWRQYTFSSHSIELSLLLTSFLYMLFMHCWPIVAGRSQTESEKDGEGFSIQQFTGCSTTCHYAACIHTKHNSTN